jgi:hypothetical protein
MTEYYRHAEGGLYLFVDDCMVKFGPDDEWQKGVIYRSEDGQWFCRTRIYFDSRFTREKVDAHFHWEKEK